MANPLPLSKLDVALSVKPEQPNQQQDTIALSFTNLSYEVVATNTGKTKKGERLQVLSGVSGMVAPGELLAILGPSGGGKTSLLNLLAGREAPHSRVGGSIAYNGRKREKGMKRRIAFVLQDDVMFASLTVFETLQYTAELRLPGPSSARMQVVEQLMSDLHLTGVKDTVVGQPFNRGISGGERKRLNIANELLVDPKLVLLDEPTSGLDSSSALHLLRVLGRLSKTRRSTIVSSIHQPSSQVYEKFSRVMLLAGGRVCYFGMAGKAVEYFSALGHECAVHYNPADFMLGLVSQHEGEGTSDDDASLRPNKATLAEELADAYAKHQTNIVVGSNNTSSEISNDSSYGSTNTSGDDANDDNDGSSSSPKWASSWWHQFQTLCKRSAKQQRGQTVGQWECINVVVITSVAAGLWWRTGVESNTAKITDLQGYLFFTSVFWGFWPMFNSLTTFPAERAVMAKERASGSYRLSAYFCAKSVADVPLYMALPMFYALITYHCLGLHEGFDSTTQAFGNLLVFLTVLLLNVLCAQSMGLLISTAVMDVKKAMVVAGCAMLSFMLAGGFYLDARNIPVALQWIPAIGFTTYTYPALMLNVFADNPTRSFSCSPAATSVTATATEQTWPECPVTGPTVLRSYGIDGSVASKAGVLIGMTLAFRISSYLFLRFRSS